MNKAIMLSMCTLLAVTGCKDRKQNPIEHVKEAAKERDLQNRTFASACSTKPIEALVSALMSGGQSSIKSGLSTYRIVGAEIIHIHNYYSSTDCTGDPAIVFKETGDINIDKGSKTNDGGYNIDVNYTNLKAETQTPEGVQAANAVGLCGHNDWSKSKEFDVTAKAADAQCYAAAVPRKILTIYRVDGNTLYWGGNMNSGRPAGERPSQLNMVTKYVQQP